MAQLGLLEFLTISQSNRHEGVDTNLVSGWGVGHQRDGRPWPKAKQVGVWRQGASVMTIFKDYFNQWPNAQVCHDHCLISCFQT